MPFEIFLDADGVVLFMEVCPKLAQREDVPQLQCSPFCISFITPGGTLGFLSSGNYFTNRNVSSLKDIVIFWCFDTTSTLFIFTVAPSLTPFADWCATVSASLLKIFFLDCWNLSTQWKWCESFNQYSPKPESNLSRPSTNCEKKSLRSPYMRYNDRIYLSSA